MLLTVAQTIAIVGLLAVIAIAVLRVCSTNKQYREAWRALAQGAGHPLYVHLSNPSDAEIWAVVDYYRGLKI